MLVFTLVLDVDLPVSCGGRHFRNHIVLGEGADEAWLG